MSDKLALSDMIRRPAQIPCQTQQNSGPARPSRTPPEKPARRKPPSTPPRRRKTPRRLPAGARGPLPCPGRPQGLPPAALFRIPPPAGSGAPRAPRKPSRRHRRGSSETPPERAAQRRPRNLPTPVPASRRLSAPRLSGRLAALAETAKAYARSAQADNTQRAYAADWRHFASWVRRQGLAETPPDPEAVGLYLASPQVEPPRRGAFGRHPRAAPVRDRLAIPTTPASRSKIRDRRISRPCWPASAAATAALPCRKARSSPTSFWPCWRRCGDGGLQGLRDRAILAIGFAGGLRRSEIVGLDCGPDQTEDGSGWIEIFPEGALLTIRGKTGWREVEIGRGSRADTCPVALLETWLRLGRIGHGPLFRAIARKNGGVSGARLTDKHVVRLVKTCALAAGLRGDLAEGERRVAFGGHSLRAGLASSAQIEEAHVQKHLGHASAEMTRRYQRKRDRFQVNLTKAAGL